MNGTAAKIEIIKPFEDAIDVTRKILFQPFVIGKWFVIGFAAFLGGHFGGGGGFRFPMRGFGDRNVNNDVVSPYLEQWKPWLPVAIATFIFLALVLIVLFAWLRARGTFIFTDCIARNRAAIVEPWHEYRREGNSYFLFGLAVMFASMAIFGALCLAIVLPLGIFEHGMNSHAFTPLLLLLLVLLFIAWLCFAFFFGVTTYFMVPLMYVRRYRAVEAFRQVANLVFENPGPFILFCLFSICLLIGAAIVGAVATCVTCCIAALPYVGTVVLLPVYVCLRSFALLFIRQFGADYDVWAAVAPAPPPQAIEPPPLPGAAGVSE